MRLLRGKRRQFIPNSTCKTRELLGGRTGKGVCAWLEFPCRLCHRYRVFIGDHLKLLEALRDPLIHLQIFFHTIEGTIFLQRNNRSEWMKWLESRSAFSCIEVPTSLVLMVREVKSRTQSAKHISVSLLYEMRNSENCKRFSEINLASSINTSSFVWCSPFSIDPCPDYQWWWHWALLKVRPSLCNAVKLGGLLNAPDTWILLSAPLLKIYSNRTSFEAVAQLLSCNRWKPLTCDCQCRCSAAVSRLSMRQQRAEKRL